MAALSSYGLLDTPQEPEFDRITALASYLFRAPIAAITLLDGDRQWFKSSTGLLMNELPRKDAFCSHAILQPEGLEVPDAEMDERFANNPMVRGDPGIRFYLGIPLLTEEGYALGTLCVIDTQPRPPVDREHREALAALAAEAMAQATMRRSSRVLSRVFLDQKRAEVRRLLRCSIIEGVAIAGTMEQALEFVLSQICMATGWKAGIAWRFPMESTGLRCEAWHSSQTGLEALRQAGLGNPGSMAEEVWRSGKPRYVTDFAEVPQYKGLQLARQLGFRAAAAFPVSSGGATELVLEFFTPDANDGCDLHFDLIEEVTSRLGAIFHRKGDEERRREDTLELQRINQIKDQFLALLAHELRNPMAPILNAVELLKTPDPGDALEVIERQVRHMARLVEDLLDISRVTRGKITLHIKRLDLAEALRSAMRAASSLTNGRPEQLTAVYPPAPLWVDADPVRIEQVIGNLINNALKYSGPEKAVSIVLRAEGVDAVLEVRDEGIGIEPDLQEQIFEPFFQTSDSRAFTQGGLGLGLPLVRQLVGLHSGTIGVRSEGRGKGSIFFVRLPLAAIDGEREAVKEEPPQEVGALMREGAAEQPLLKRRVLVVEDNRDFARTLERLLRLWGHEVEVVAHGNLALEAAHAFSPDVAMIDIGLPGMDGCSLAEKLVEELGPGLYLIAMTGFSQDADRERALNSGFRELLLKPIDPESLREKLGRAFAQPAP